MTSVEVGMRAPVFAASYPHGRTDAARLKDSDGDGRPVLRTGARVRRDWRANYQRTIVIRSSVEAIDSCECLLSGLLVSR